MHPNGQQQSQHPRHNFGARGSNDSASSQETTRCFVLHKTASYWWLYERISGQYVKALKDRPPANRPGELINALIELGISSFNIQILQS